jgi:V/A-type H+-transporting ATPase subunit F
MKMAIIGESNVVLGFRPLGIETYPVTDATEAEEKLKNLVQSRDYAIIYLAESLASQMKELVAQLGKFSNIIVIPVRGGTLGLARDRLKKISARALGTDILKEEVK